jgi:hypothetical protein
MSLTFILVLLTFYIHLMTLKGLNNFLPHTAISNYNQVLIIVIVLFIAHLFEISIYAIIYKLAIEFLNIGSLVGEPINNFMEYLYYSIVMYTSLGLGDVYPVGHIRFITGVEALNGLMLITWSASFTFLAMKRLWPWQDPCSK